MTSSALRLRIFSLTAFLWLVLFGFMAKAQEAPGALPEMRVTTDKVQGDIMSSFTGNAPMQAVFSANPQNPGDYEPRYEWQFIKAGEKKPFLIRHDEQTSYNFIRSGTFYIKLYITFLKGGTSINYEMDTPFVVSISESRLETPNAFTPNGDGVNDVFRVKDGYQSIVSFKASVYNRWGKRLFSWTDISKGWDGTFRGKPVPDGAYYLNLYAKGADGRIYDVRKTINLLRGFQENGGAQP